MSKHICIVIFLLSIFCKSQGQIRVIPTPPNITYHALLIGAEDYRDPFFAKLSHPIDDAHLLSDVLIQKYSFEKQNVRILTNPTRNDILNTLDKYVSELNENDYLLVFYAGHGSLRREEGYWIPVDAKRDMTNGWIANIEIQFRLRQLEAKHALVISDACFSGSILRDAAEEQLKITRSRKAITSGNLSTVPDKSVFMEYFIKALKDNDKKYLLAGELYQSIKKVVINNSSVIPEYGIIQNTRDEGGEFIFYNKNGTTNVINPGPVIHTKVNCQVKGNGITRQEIKATGNSRVSIKASGQVTVGMFLGSTSPAGINTIGSNTYNLIRNYPHGSLLFRLSTDAPDKWRLCGVECNFDMPASGKVEVFFQVNDIEQQNNSGNFNLEIDHL